MAEFGRIDQRFARIDQRFEYVYQRFDELKDELLHEMHVLDERRQHQFELLAENFKDHGVRIKTLEVHTGLRAP